MSFTLTYSRLTSLAQDDTELNEIEQTGDAVLTGGVNSIGERKKLYCRFTVEPEDDTISLPGASLYFNPALYVAPGLATAIPPGLPNTGFSLVIPESVTEYETINGIDMPFYSFGTDHPEACKNFRARFYYFDTDDFAIELEYYNCFDENGYLNNTPKSNQWRFISEYWNELNTNIVDSSIYNTEKELRLYLYLASGDINDSQEKSIYQGQFESYNGVLDLISTDTGNEITSFSTVNENAITARLYTVNNTIDKFYARLIRIQDNQSLNMIDNYELNENEIVAGNPDENAILGPFTSARVEIDGYYELTFYVDPAYLTIDAKYRLVIYAYDQGGVGYDGAETFQGVGAELLATPVVPYCESNCVDDYITPSSLLVTASLFDIDKEWTGNFLTCCIEERMKAVINIEYSDDRWKNNLLCRRGTSQGEVTESNDIRKYLTGIQMEIYEEHTDVALGGTVRNLLDVKYITKTSYNTFTGSSGAPTLTFDTVNEIMSLSYEFRNRNEISYPALATFLNGAPYLPILGDQYWGGKDVFIKWELAFYYYDWPTPFMDKLQIIQKMVVKDYSDDVTITPTSGTLFCPENEFCLEASIVLADPETYNLVNTIEILNGSNLQESENYVPGELAQQTNAIFTSQDADYTGGEAAFCLSGATLFLNQNYKISAMAKKQ